MITAGIDVGSVATKAVIVREGKIAGQAIMPTGANPRSAAEQTLGRASEATGIAGLAVERTVSTGYGRRAINLDGRVVTEITAAARGAHWLGRPDGPVGTVVDLGGQDTKVILLNSNGSVADFAMNDKCAAGTGRFLSLMAYALEVPLSEMGDLSLRAEAPVTINSTCTVFAETEVVSLVAQGRKKEDIVAGLHAAIASRIASMVRQMGGRDIFFIGGGAKNAGVRKALESALQCTIYVPLDPQFVVAVGAAIIAAQNSR